MNREMSGPHFIHKEGRYELMGFGRSWFCREQAKRPVGVGGGGVVDKVWDRETTFSQLAKRSPCVVVSGKLRFSFHSKYFL